MFDAFFSSDSGYDYLDLAQVFLYSQRFFKRNGIGRIHRKLDPIEVDARTVGVNSNSGIRIGNALERYQNFHRQSSKIPAPPIPPPTHMVTSP